MANQLFVMGSDDERHVYGGICRGTDMLQAIATGFDYGGDSPFDLKGEIGKSGAFHAFVFPVSDRVAQRFCALVEAFGKLDKANRLPLYFSQDLRFNPHLEIEGETPLEPDGSPCENVTPEQFYPHEKSDFLLGANVKYRPSELMKAPGLRWVRVNCLTAFNLNARLSGIDLTLFNADWWKMGRGADFVQTCRAQFESAADPQFYDRWPGLTVKDLRLQSGHRAITIGSKKLISRTKDSLPVTAIYNLVRVGVDHMGGYDHFLQLTQDWAPFDAPPLAVPAYLQAEFDRLQIEIP